MDSVNSHIYKLTREKGVAHYEQCMGDKRKGVKPRLFTAMPSEVVESHIVTVF